MCKQSQIHQLDMPEHHELTDFQKGEIVGMRRSSSPTKISGELDIPQQTISSFLQRFNERGSIDNVKPPGLQGHEKLLHEGTVT